MSRPTRRDFIRVCSIVLGALSPITATRAKADLAVTAERVAVDFAGAVEGLATALQSAGEKALADSALGLQGDISKLGELLESTMKDAASQAAAMAEAEEKTGSAKVLSVIASVVMVIVAVVVAVFTFGAGSALVAAAVIAVGAVIGQAAAAAAQLTGGARVVAQALLSVLSQSVVHLEALAKAPEADKARVRRVALADLLGAMVSVKTAIGSVSKVSGACGADIRVIGTTCERVHLSLAALIAYLRRLQLSSSGDGQAMIEALMRVQRGFGDATTSLKIGCGTLSSPVVNKAPG